MTETIKCWLCARLREPSTWAGFAIPLGTLGTQLVSPYSVIAYVASAVCACLAVILGEKK